MRALDLESGHQGFGSGSAPPSQADLGQGPSGSEPQFLHPCKRDISKSTCSSRLLGESLEIRGFKSALSHTESDTKKSYHKLIKTVALEVVSSWSSGFLLGPGMSWLLEPCSPWAWGSGSLSGLLLPRPASCLRSPPFQPAAVPADLQHGRWDADGGGDGLGPP